MLPSLACLPNLVSHAPTPTLHHLSPWDTHGQESTTQGFKHGRKLWQDTHRVGAATNGVYARLWLQHSRQRVVCARRGIGAAECWGRRWRGRAGKGAVSVVSRVGLRLIIEREFNHASIYSADAHSISLIVECCGIVAGVHALRRPTCQRVKVECGRRRAAAMAAVVDARGRVIARRNGRHAANSDARRPVVKGRIRIEIQGTNSHAPLLVVAAYAKALAQIVAHATKAVAGQRHRGEKQASHSAHQGVRAHNAHRDLSNFGDDGCD